MERAANRASGMKRQAIQAKAQALRCQCTPGSCGDDASGQLMRDSERREEQKRNPY
jgi:hypothetical protein